MKRVLLLVATLSAAVATAANTWYVDAVGGNDANDGKSMATAVKTLKAAMELPFLADGDTVIALPGVYDSGRMAGGDHANARVVISKEITLKSLSGRATRDVTTIKGESPDSENGPMRCVTLSAGIGKTARIEGFTLCEGYTSATEEDDASNRGGGALVQSGTGYVIDCLIRDCSARTGGGLAMIASSAVDGAAVRCHIRSCTATTQGLAINNMPAYWCVFSDFPEGTQLNVFYHSASYPRPCIHSTFYCKAPCAAGSSGIPVVGPFLNTVIIQATQINSRVYATNCVMNVTEGDNCENFTKVESKNIMMAPAADDYRIVAGSAAVDFGNAEFLGLIPEEFRSKDFNGNAVAATENSKITVGACTVPATPVGGFVTFNNNLNYKVAGRRVVFNWTRICSDIANADVKIEADYGDEVGIWSVTDSRGVSYATRDGVATVALPPLGALNITDAVQTSRVVRVGASRAYATIQDAVESAESETVILVDPAVYATGGEFGCGLSNRVFIAEGKKIQLLSVDGPESTIIEGGAAPIPVVGELSSEEYGLGTNAVRCMAIESTATVRIDGFTFRGGRTNYDGLKSPINESGGCGGGIYCKTDAAYVKDCVITNCHAVRGGGVYNGTYVNCRLLYNRALYTASAGTQTLNSGVNSQKLRLYGCLLDGNSSCSTILYYWHELVSCTFGARNRGLNLNSEGGISGNMESKAIRNSLFLRKHDKPTHPLALANCAYLASFAWGDNSTFEKCKTADAFEVDDDYAPVASEGNALLDSADPSHWDATYYGDKDLAGRLRFRSGLMDIGCRQADMTPVYAALAGPTGRIALDASQADVASMESGIILKSGTLNMEIGSRSVNMPVAVSGNCVCVVRRTDNGQCCGAYTSETGGTLKLDKFASYEFVCYAVDRLASDAGILVGEGVLAVEPFRISIR